MTKSFVTHKRRVMVNSSGVSFMICCEWWKGFVFMYCPSRASNDRVMSSTGNFSSFIIPKESRKERLMSIALFLLKVRGVIFKFVM